MVSSINNELANPEYDRHQFGTANYVLSINLSEEGYPVTTQENVVNSDVDDLVGTQVDEIHNDTLQQDEHYKSALVELANKYNSFKVPIKISSFVRTGGEVEFTL